jgi:NaMN:DMB phosphoribosyltransferase
MSFNNGNAGIQRVAVICRNKTAQSIVSWTTLTGWIEVQDPTNSFDPATGVFTAPRAGVYDFSLGDAIQAGIGAYLGLSIIKNGTQMYNHLESASSAAIQYKDLAGSVEMLAGDTLSPRAFQGTAANDSPSISNSWFTITERNTNF